MAPRRPVQARKSIRHNFMVHSDTRSTPGSTQRAGLSLAQQGNLRFLESAIRAHWRLGQNVVLCWARSEDGIDILFVPHYFLGNFSATLNDCSPTDRLEALNGSFIRKLITGSRMMSSEDFSSTARRFELTPTVIALPVPLENSDEVTGAVESLLKRYSISFVESRAVLLFDIVDFSLFSPFEQTSQLNSLSYSLNSAYNKLKKLDIDINFARTTTGDGFYVWSRNETLLDNVHLFLFMILVVADNAIAKRKSTGNTVPVIRTGFHIGSHYEFYQAEGVNPSMFSFIVGDVTIELARMLECAQPGQIFVGDFKSRLPTSLREGAYEIDVDTARFIERVKKLKDLGGVVIAGEKTDQIHYYLSGEAGVSGGESIRRYVVSDKHGKTRIAHNLRINIYRPGRDPILLGMQDYFLPKQRDGRHFLARESNTVTLQQPDRRKATLTTED